VAPCPTGEARITPGFDLPARYVIHAVGPIWRGGRAGEEQHLASAYRSAMSLANEYAIASVAFPAISTGIYGYPVDRATAVAVATIRESLRVRGSIARVVCACFNDEALHAYQSAGVGALQE
jgi:O-acetyl-ADP-ribose deacetylase (regulator of RNase III)